MTVLRFYKDGPRAVKGNFGYEGWLCRSYKQARIVTARMPGKVDWLYAYLLPWEF